LAAKSFVAAQVGALLLSPATFIELLLLLMSWRGPRDMILASAASDLHDS
jgi:hypothetical protein